MVPGVHVEKPQGHPRRQRSDERVKKYSQPMLIALKARQIFKPVFTDTFPITANVFDRRIFRRYDRRRRSFDFDDGDGEMNAHERVSKPRLETQRPGPRALFLF